MNLITKLFIINSIILNSSLVAQNKLIINNKSHDYNILLLIEDEQFDSALKYINKNCTEIHTFKETDKYNLLKAIIYLEIKESDSASIFLEKINDNSSLSDEKYLAEGIMYYRKSNFKNALEHLLNSEKIKINAFSEKLNEVLKAYFQLYLGRTYAEIGLYTFSVEEYIKAYKLFKKYKLENFAANSNKFLGRAYTFFAESDAKYYEAAENEFKQALNYYEKSKKQEQLNWIYIILSDFYIQQNNADSSFQYLSKLNKIVNNTPDKNLEGLYHNNIGETNMLLKELNTAEKSFFKAIDCYNSNKNIVNKTITFYNLSKLYSEKNEIVKAVMYADSAYNFSLLSDIKQKTAQILKFKAELYYRLNNPEAYLLHKEYDSIKTKIFNKQNYYISYSFREKYENEKLKNSNDELVLINKVNSQKLTVGIFVAATVILVVLLFVIILFLKRKQKKHELQNRLNSLQLQSVQSQMYPHLLFNATSAAASVIYKEKREIAYDYLVKTSQLMRRALIDNNRLYKTLQEELDFVENYLEIQKIRFPERFDYEINVDEKLDTSKTVPQMIIQTYVENSIKYGIEALKEGGLLLINLKQTPVQIEIEIRDNGVGIETSKTMKIKGTGNGIKIMNEIYKIHNQSKKEQISFQIIDLYKEGKKGTAVIITIKNSKLT
jgi:tetratricopeptide (TPR) repeat protein